MQELTRKVKGCFLVITYMIIVSSCSSRKNEKHDVVIKEGVEYKVTFYETGELKSEQPLKNGIPFGVQNVYFPNGNLKECITWYDGNIYSHQYQYFNSLDTFRMIRTNDTILALRPQLKRYDYVNEGKVLAFTATFTENGFLDEIKGKSTVEFKVDKNFSEDSIKLVFVYPILNLLRPKSKLITYDENNQLGEVIDLKYNLELSTSQVLIKHQEGYSYLITNEWNFRNRTLRDTAIVVF